MSKTKQDNCDLRSGFTLVEVIISTALTLLLFFGAITIYVAAAKFSINTSAACYAATDAANAVQHTAADAQEAHWIALPGEPGWTPPSGLSTSAFQTFDSNASIFTGVELVFPRDNNRLGAKFGRRGTFCGADAL